MKYINYCISAIMLLVMFLIPCGCSNNSLDIDYSDAYVFGQDSQENFIAYQNRCHLAESDDSYYYINNNGFIYVIDKATYNCRPLCSRNDCLHDKEYNYDKKLKCNAFLNILDDYDSLIYYNSNLYFNTDKEYKDKDGYKRTKYEIYKLSLDGTKRDIVYSTTDICIWSFKIHRGYIYFEGSNLDNDGTALGSNSALYKVSVDGKGETTELFPYYKYGIQKNMIVSDTRFYGNHIFLMIDYGGEAVSQKYLINYNLQTGKWINLSEKLEVNAKGFFTIFNNKLVFANGNKIYECDFNGNNEKEILDCKKILDSYKYYNPLTNDGENLIITASDDGETADKLIFCNKNYEAKVYKMPFAFIAETGCDSNVFITFNSDDSRLYLIDKKLLGDNTKATELYKF